MKHIKKLTESTFLETFLDGVRTDELPGVDPPQNCIKQVDASNELRSGAG